MGDLKELKASIRSVLLSCGKTATEQEFRKAYAEMECESFNVVLQRYKTSFVKFFSMIPDVAKVIYANNLVFIQRVSSDASSHMDHLTINKYGKNYKGPKLVTKSGAIKGRSLNAKALPYNYSNYSTISTPRYYSQNQKSYPQRNTGFKFTFDTKKSYQEAPKAATQIKPLVSSVRQPVKTSTTNNLTVEKSAINSANKLSLPDWDIRPNPPKITAPIRPLVSSNKEPVKSSTANNLSVEKSAINSANKLSLPDWDVKPNPPKITVPTRPLVSSNKEPVEASTINNLNVEKSIISSTNKLSLPDWDVKPNPPKAAAPVRPLVSSIKELVKISSVSKAPIVENKTADRVNNDQFQVKKEEDVKINPQNIIESTIAQERKAPPKIQPTASSTAARPCTNLQFKGNRLFQTAVQQICPKDDKNQASSNNPFKSVIASRSSHIQNTTNLDRMDENLTNHLNQGPKKEIKDEKIEVDSFKIEPVESKNTLVNEVVEEFKAFSFKNAAEMKTLSSAEVDKKESKISSPKNPLDLRNRLREMRQFRQILKTVGDPVDNSEKEVIIQLGQPIKHEEKPFFEVKVLDVLSPHKFTFQFSFQILKDLTEKLDQFYSDLKDDELGMYRAKEFVKNNIVVVCLEGRFHRAQITSCDNNDVYVQLVDSLKIQPQKVSTSQIFSIHQRFTTDSPKSAYGSIHGVKPKNQTWCPESTLKLINIQHKVVLATVKSVVNDVYHLSIIVDKSSCREICDMLIDENMAEFDKDAFNNSVVFRSLE